MRCPLFRSKGRQPSLLLISSAILILSILILSGLVGCGPSTENLEAVDYMRLNWRPSMGCWS